MALNTLCVIIEWLIRQQKKQSVDRPERHLSRGDHIRRVRPDLVEPALLCGEDEPELLSDTDGIVRIELIFHLQALTEINVLAGKHLRDTRLSMKGIPPKLRALTDAYLESKGIAVKVDPISILDQDFESQVSKRKRTKTKAAEVEHAIRHHLDVELDDDPDLQASFVEALAKIFEEYRDNWQKIYEALEKLRERIRNP